MRSLTSPRYLDSTMSSLVILPLVIRQVSPVKVTLVQQEGRGRVQSTNIIVKLIDLHWKYKEKHDITSQHNIAVIVTSKYCILLLLTCLTRTVSMKLGSVTNSDKFLTSW